MKKLLMLFVVGIMALTSVMGSVCDEGASNSPEVFCENACANEGSGYDACIEKCMAATDCGNNDVPEFGTIGAAIALLGAGAVVYKKRN